MQRTKIVFPIMKNEVKYILSPVRYSYCENPCSRQVFALTTSISQSNGFCTGTNWTPPREWNFKRKMANKNWHPSHSDQHAPVRGHDWDAYTDVFPKFLTIFFFSTIHIIKYTFIETNHKCFPIKPYYYRYHSAKLLILLNSPKK